MMNRLVMAGALFASALLLPWWVTAVCVLLSLAVFGMYAAPVLAGLLMDFTFGSPALFGFPYLYTAAFLALSVLAYVLNRMMIE